MSLLDDFARVSRSSPCPVCARHDWCLVSRSQPDDPAKVICARVESRRRFGQAGWLHVLRDDGKRWDGIRRRTLPLSDPEPNPALAAFAQSCREKLADHPANELALTLGVSDESLARLGVGWNGAAWTFPMVDSRGRVIGVALRHPNGSKYAVDGGHHGLFVPTGIDASDRLVVCEGQSDTAAVLDLGFKAIGRPGAMSSERMVFEFARARNPRTAVVLGDGDEPGIAGAERLAAGLAVAIPDVRIVYPPAGIKDARDWKRRGGAALDIEAAIAAASPVKLRVARAEVRA